MGNAQIVNIPDPVFKQALLFSGIDTNFDSEIQVSEAEACTSIGISPGGQVTDLTGIEAFINLTEITLSSISMQTFAIDLPRLKRLRFWGPTSIADVDLRACDSLTNLALGWSDCHYQTVNVSGMAQLDTILNTGLTNVLLANNCPSLKAILDDMELEAVYDILDVTNCVNLKTIHIGQLSVSNLDLSTCTSGVALSFIIAPNLSNLNTKNNAHDSWYTIDAAFHNPVINICADSFELNSIIQNMGYSAATTIVVSPYCSYYPGGSYNTIRGELRIDLNSNGCDNADITMSHVPINISDNFGNNFIKYTDGYGKYNFYGFVGDFTLTPSFPSPYFTVAPNPATVNFATANNLIDTTDFCVSPAGIYNDLEIVCLPSGPARPGFTADYMVRIKNRGTTTLSGNVQLNFDNAEMSFISSAPVVSTQTAGLLTWDYTNLQPFQELSYYIGFNLFAPPVNNIGDTLHFLATVNPVSSDETPINNSAVLNQQLVGSYDPNDKVCAEGNKIDISSLNKNLHYIIHFQNLGTDTAFNVVVADTLTNNADWESFDFLGSSHPCHVTRIKNNLEFYFENIKLPYQSVNNAGSNGYVAFQVKPKNTLVVGDSINNTASIYFDYNLPVVTNKAVTIVSPTSPLSVRLEYFSLTSKEQNNLLTWKVAADLTTTFNIERSNDGIHFNNIGNIMATTQRCQLPFNFTDEKPLNGKNYYRIKITDVNGVSFYSKILVTGKTRSGFEIIAITSDQNNTNLYLNVSKDQTINMKMIAADGKMVYSKSKTIAAGTNQLSLQTGNLSKGIYTLLVYTSEGELITKRFLK